MTKLFMYLASLIVLLISAFLVFRLYARYDYRERGQLTLLCSLLELTIWLGYTAVPYIYNPPCWPFVWSCDSSSPWIVTIPAYLILATGALGFGSMLWLGLRRSFGQHVTTLIQSGPYRFTRNPQVLGGFLMVAGIVLLWPSWYAVGWAMVWIAMFHPMVLTEEEHLLRVHGDEYERYCKKVPRYMCF